MSSELVLPGLKAGKDEFLARMAPLPLGYAGDDGLRVGLANVDTLGLTVIVASETRPPMVFNPHDRQWHPLQARGNKVLTPSTKLRH